MLGLLSKQNVAKLKAYILSTDYDLVFCQYLVGGIVGLTCCGPAVPVAVPVGPDWPLTLLIVTIGSGGLLPMALATEAAVAPEVPGLEW